MINELCAKSQIDGSLNLFMYINDIKYINKYFIKIQENMIKSEDFSSQYK